MKKSLVSALWLTVAVAALAAVLGLALDGDPGPPVYTWPDTTQGAPTCARP